MWSWGTFKDIDVKVTFTAVARLTILIHFVDYDIDLRIQRDEAYLGYWRNNWVQATSIDMYLCDYVKHVKRLKNRDYEDNRFTYYGYSKRFVNFVWDKQKRLMDELNGVIDRLKHSYQADMRCLYMTEQRFRLAEQEVRGCTRL